MSSSSLTSYTMLDIFDTFLYKKKINQTEFREILRTFNYLLVKDMVDNGTTYKLPFRLGTLSVRKAKNKRKHLYSFAIYRQTGEKILYTNKHSEGYYARFHWNKWKPQMMLETRSLFKFKPTKPARKYLAKSILERNTINKYYEHD